MRTPLAMIFLAGTLINTVVGHCQRPKRWEMFGRRGMKCWLPTRL
jgi:hypothetical protein